MPPRRKKVTSPSPSPEVPDVPLRRSKRISALQQTTEVPRRAADSKLSSPELPPDENFASSSSSTATRKRRGPAVKDGTNGVPKPKKKAVKKKAAVVEVPSATTATTDTDDHSPDDDSDFEMDEVKEDSTDTAESVDLTSSDESLPSPSTKKSQKGKNARKRSPSVESDVSDEGTGKKKTAKKAKAVKPLRKKTDNSGGITIAKNAGRSEQIEMKAGERHLHDTFDFLKPEYIKDAQGHRPDHPDYDPKTLFIPEDFMKKQTPSMRQYWTIKANYFDTVVCFRVGKFYELYHLDAVVGLENLDLAPVRAPYAHCGFPEVSFGKYSSMLIARGYTCTRVEQTERGDARDRRCEANKGHDKIVIREVCQIVNTATQTYSVYDGDSKKDSFLAVDPNASYLMSIVEATDAEDNGRHETEYGICLLDASTGKFVFSKFTDDACRSILRTLGAHFQPCHIIYPKHLITTATQSVFNGTLSAARKEFLFDKREFLPVDYTIKKLSADKIYTKDLEQWPFMLRKFLNPDTPTPEVLPEYEVVFRALGGILFYLERSLIDVDMFSMKNFSWYTPPGKETDDNFDDVKMNPTGKDRWDGRSMVLDGATLMNLHLVPPYAGHKAIPKLRDATSAKFSLYSTLDYCKTAFGKRLLRQWICAPTCDPAELKQRQDAVESLTSEEMAWFRRALDEAFTKMPDLERLVQKIHTNGLKYRASEHPNSRATFFFADSFNKRKITDFVAILNGLSRIVKLHEKLEDERARHAISVPKFIEECIGTEFPDVHEDLKHFYEAFDHKTALATGRIAPKKGIAAEYDHAVEVVESVERMIHDYEERERKKWDCEEITARGVGKWKFMYLEFPDSVADQLPMSEYRLKTKRKGFKRFCTDELETLIERLYHVEKLRNDAAGDIGRQVFADFAARKDKWDTVISKVAVLDVVASFAAYSVNSKNRGFPMCRPELKYDRDETFVKMVTGYHPLLIGGSAKLAKKTLKVVPNDLEMGKYGDDEDDCQPLIVCLTGPNMGGKSTLMRQVAMMVVMAQMGCPVPAEEFQLTPVDRIFSRIGAHDCSFAGQSTFFVELSETNNILRNATPDSFVVIDELGRGTSTNDGTAIAAAVLREIANNLNCRTFFSTHYFSVCDLVKGNSKVRQAHMNFMVENEDDDDPTNEEVTYLYKFADGICTKSYGFFAAKLAGMPTDLIRDGHASHVFLEQQQQRHRETLKKRMESQHKIRKLQQIRQLCETGNTDMDLLSGLIAAL